MIRADKPVTFDARLKSPFTALLAGPTGCGKTRLMFDLIRNRGKVCTKPPVEIVYCYGSWQEGFDEWREVVTFHEGFLDPGTAVPADGRPRWMVVDDLLEEVTGKESLNNSFTKHSHHRNLSVFFSDSECFQEGNSNRVAEHALCFYSKTPAINK